MAVRTADWERTPARSSDALTEIFAFPTSFGKLLRNLRVRTGLSQNQLARRSGVDPAYVNRLERAPDDSQSLPSRKIVVSLWQTLVTEGEFITPPISSDDRERLLTAAGLCPEVILLAGGWDAYTRRLNDEVLGATEALLARVRAAVAVAKGHEDG
jgi:transcriptional regulator with XRE-family HTH domain